MLEHRHTPGLPNGAFNDKPSFRIKLIVHKNLYSVFSLVSEGPVSKDPFSLISEGPVSKDPLSLVSEGQTDPWGLDGDGASELETSPGF